MSDPVSSMDVEDVLSSIRRLVSEEAKGSAPEQPQSDNGPSGPVDIYQAAEQAVDAAVDDIVHGDATSFPHEAPLEAHEAPPSDMAAEAATDEEDGPMSFRHQAAAAVRRGQEQKLVLTAALRVASPEADKDGAINPTVPEAGPRPQHPHLRPVGPGAFDPAPASSSDPAEDNVAPPTEAAPENPIKASDDGRQTPARVRPFDFAPEDTLFDRAKRAMSDVDAGPAAAQDPDTPLGAAFVSRPEAADGQGAANPTSTINRTAPASPFSAARSPIQPDDAPVAAPSPEEEDPSTINFAESEESILDEETLRDMVSEMVREELQGELGDRITRNVRKLVRREIQRAIASREFE